jgi:hypothetical protein
MLILVYKLMHLEFLLINHWMENNMKIHLEEVHMEDSHSIHLFDHLNGHNQHVDPRMFIPPWYQPHVVQFVPEPTTKLSYKKYNIQPTSKTLIQMLISKYSKRPLKLMMKSWTLTLSTCLVLFSKIIFLNGMRILSKIIQIKHLKN